MSNGADGADSTSPINYSSWTKIALLKRVKYLEAELQDIKNPAVKPELALESPAQNDEGKDGANDGEVTPGTTTPKVKGQINQEKYSTRFIALKLAYLGKNYSGFEFQATTNQTTIEEELWVALVKTCLIFPKDGHVVDFTCCEYSKCGRTDRGVSAFGQVIALRVRSKRPLPKKPVPVVESEGEAGVDSTAEGVEEDAEPVDVPPPKPFDDVHDEIDYARILNKMLPEDIRILAWCPSPPPGFDSRFSCRERQYKYFFTQPAFSPVPAALETECEGVAKPGWLDIETMREAAKRYEGEHDFRNFCKVDPAKLITNFHRVIFEASIEEVEDVTTALPYLTGAGFAPADMDTTKGIYPKVYSFNVRGSAFLWHQIRHMVAVLFLVGQGLEQPSVIDGLLDAERCPGRPPYVLADDVPLVLWDCIFPGEDSAEHPDGLHWIWSGDDNAEHKYGRFNLMDGVWETWRGRKIDELLAGQLLKRISRQGRQEWVDVEKMRTARSTQVYEGGNTFRLGGRNHIPLLSRKLMQTPEEQNDKYVKRKGFSSVEEMKGQRRTARLSKLQAEAEANE